MELFDTMDAYGRRPPADGQPIKAASVRNLIGECAEEITCRALNLTRRRIDGREKVNSDAETQDGRPVEIKAVGKNNTALIYKFRLEKEREAHGDQYPYIFCRHTCTVDIGGGGAVADYFRDHPPELILCTLADIVAVIGDRPPRLFKMFTGKENEPQPGEKFDRKKHHGTHREGYADGGWQFRLSALGARPCETATITWRQTAITIQINRTHHA